MSTTKYVSELQNVNPSAVIELFELELTQAVHGRDQTYYFHAGSSLNLNGKIEFLVLRPPCLPVR